MGSAERPRLSIFRSKENMSVQIINDRAGETVVSVSTLSKDMADRVSGKRGVEKAREIGFAIAEKAKDKGIETIVFDRSGYAYHGRVKMLADAAREGGLQF